MRSITRSAVAFRFYRAFAWSSVLQAVSRLQAAVLLFVAARLLSTDQFGALFAIQAAGLLVSSFWDFGSTTFVMREVAAGVMASGRALRQSLLQRLIFLPAILVALLCVVVLLPAANEIGLLALALLLASPLAIGIATAYNSVLLGSSHFRKASLTTAGGRVVQVIALLFMLWVGSSHPVRLEYIAGALLIGELVILLAQRWEALRLIHSVGLKGSSPEQHLLSVREFMSRSIPHAANSIFNYAYNKGDILFVSALAGVGAAAGFAPGSQLQNVLVLIPTLLCAGIVPILSGSSAQDWAGGTARRTVWRIAVVGFLSTVFVCTALGITVEWWLPLVVGDNVARSAAVPALILLASVPIFALHAPLSQALISQGVPGRTTAAYAAGFVSSGVLHLILVPDYGAVGGAVAGLLRDPICLLLVLLYYRRQSKRS